MAEDKLTFEQALVQLESIVEALEKGDVALDESMKLFEEGTKLVGKCNAMLKEAEQKVSVLQEGNNGEDEEFPFEED